MDTRKFFIFMVGVFLPLWSLSKVPLYLTFSPDGPNVYDKRGLGGSINLEQWVTGFRSSKLLAPACNFILVHLAFGITVLFMSALSIYNPAWRRKYGNVFFAFAVLLSVHCFPTSFAMVGLRPNLRIALFCITCIWVCTTAICGFFTLKNYELDPEKAERHLSTEYFLITLGAWGAGFAEFAGISMKFYYLFRDGEWMTYGEGPEETFGTSVFDMLPEKVGVWIFMLTLVFVWLAWPMFLLQLPEEVKGGDAKEGASVSGLSKNSAAKVLKSKSVKHA